MSPELADGTPNKLIQVLEPCHVELLLDVLVHPEGPRLRDHLSHGEVDIFRFPVYLANHLLCIVVAFCLRFCCFENISETNCFLRKDGFSEKDGFLGKVGFPGKVGIPGKVRFSRKYNFSEMENFSCISKIVQDYRSVFHPFSCFRRECLTLIASIRDWKNLTRPNEDEFQENRSEDLFDETKWERLTRTFLQRTSAGTPSERYTSPCEGSICDQEFVLMMMGQLLVKSQMDTLFRPRYELETASLLRQVVGNCLQTSNQVSLTG